MLVQIDQAFLGPPIRGRLSRAEVRFGPGGREKHKSG